ncbi:MAG: AMP-binding protein [Deltaproteobacteria bacterium]|nr:AMP-binding protein [Deltaproteobacteria bacterium]
MLEKRIAKAKRNVQKVRLARDALKSGARFMTAEARRGTLVPNLVGLLRQGQMTRDMAWSDLLEEQAARIPDKTFLYYKDETFTYREMDENANRVAHLLARLGAGRQKGIGIYMRNSPRFLDVFFAAQKLSMYVVPINAELMGDGLAYILEHSEIALLAADAELLPRLEALGKLPKNIGTLLVDDMDSEGDVPKDAHRLSAAYAPDVPKNRPAAVRDPDDLCLIMYTSGTTGPPKGVVYTYNTTRVKLLSLLGGILVRPDDVYYTAFALCHGNAMFLTVTLAMSQGASVALSRRFSSSRFWDEVNRYGATIFNTLGSVIPILMKQPEKPTDRDNKVRVVLSAACPANMWEPFEKRFGVKIYEGYGAVDSGGRGIMNLGTAPVGSLGKPGGRGGVKVVDEQGNEVPPGVPGELIFRVKEKKSPVAYFKNEEATSKKVRDGWMYTGDLVKKDEEGFLYFVGRNTESMRRGGENVSAYEVEHVIMKHPDVEEAAVYAVPSELAEDEIMASVLPVEGKKLAPADLLAWLDGKLAKYAIPRYVRMVDSLPKTNTHRVIKGGLEKEGVTEDTWDARKGGYAGE